MCSNNSELTNPEDILEEEKGTIILYTLLKLLMNKMLKIFWKMKIYLI